VTPGDYMSKAHRAVSSARLLLTDGDADGACNRAYYAMFDAAHAALLAANPDLDPATLKTHRGLIAAVGERLVKAGRISADLGRSLNQVEQVRLLADYTGESIDLEKARWAIGQADRFIAEIGTLLTS
jgi:uncharacterized protein (UPF0332 family)